MRWLMQQSLPERHVIVGRANQAPCKGNRRAPRPQVFRASFAQAAQGACSVLRGSWDEPTRRWTMPCAGGSSFLVEDLRQDVLGDHRPPPGRGAPAAHARGAPSETWESVSVSVPGVPGSAVAVHTLAWCAERVRAPSAPSRKPAREETGDVVCCRVAPREPKEMPLPALPRRP